MSEIPRFTCPCGFDADDVARRAYWSHGCPFHPAERVEAPAEQVEAVDSGVSWRGGLIALIAVLAVLAVLVFICGGFGSWR